MGGRAFIPVVLSLPMQVGFVVIAAWRRVRCSPTSSARVASSGARCSVRRKPAEAITSRFRRRRQGFAVEPDTDPGVMATGAADWRRRRGRRPPPWPDIDTDAEARSPLRLRPPAAATSAAPAATPRPARRGEDQADSAERRVVIDPTNLQ